MTAQSTGYKLRQRPMTPARSLGSPLTGRFQRMLDHAEAAIAQPLAGVTADGAIIPGLFPLRETGVSTRPIKDAADAFLASLSEAERAATVFPIDSDAWRRWSNIHPFLMRHGALLETLSPVQREAALALVRESLSARGFAHARDVMKLNHTIGELAGNFVEYGEWVYWLSIFGTPSLDEPWGWQIDGHHLIINCLVLGDQVVMAPVFLGSEPVVADSGLYAGTRVCAEEEGRGLELVRALTPAQQSRAILYPSALFRDLPAEPFNHLDGHMYAAAFHDNARVPYEGITADALSPGQQELLLGLIDVYVGRMRPGHDAVKMAEVKAHLAETRFAWIGATDEEAVFYYRIQSPVILIEFDHQRGIVFDFDEPTRTHIHTVVRTPNGNDYGADLLRQHYARFH